MAPAPPDDTKASKLTSAAGVTQNPNARLNAFYLSRDRVLSLIGTQGLPANVLGALQGKDVAMASAILSGIVGSYVLGAVATSGIKTLQQLVVEDALQPGTPFIYNGHFYGKGFGDNNKKPSLSLTEKLDEPLAGKKLIFQFAKDGLVNDTAYVRMSGSTRLFAFGYVSEIDADTIRAIPYIIGDLVEFNSSFTPLEHSLELQPDAIDQFLGMDQSWMPSKEEFKRLSQIPEHAVKELVCDLLGEFDVPKDWGGEECDVLSANLLINAVRKTGAFLLKGPARFHPMTLKDCGKNGDQIYRLFNIPAQVYVVQHCHNIGAAVRKTVEAFAMQRALTVPCRYMFIDGATTARLFRAHGRWQ